MALVLHVPIVIPFLLEHAVTYSNEVYSLKKHDTVFLKRQKMIFIVARIV